MIVGKVTGKSGPVSPFVVSPWAFTDPEFIRWGVSFARHCVVGYSTRQGFLDVFGRFCVHALHETVAHENIADKCDYRRGGSYVMFKDADEFDEVCNKVRELATRLPMHVTHCTSVVWFTQNERAGSAIVPLSPSDLVRRQPSLRAHAKELAGAFWDPADVTADCHKFTNELASICRRDLGVRFKFNTTAMGFLVSQRPRAAATSVRARAANR